MSEKGVDHDALHTIGKLNVFEQHNVLSLTLENGVQHGSGYARIVDVF